MVSSTYFSAIVLEVSTVFVIHFGASHVVQLGETCWVFNVWFSLNYKQMEGNNVLRKTRIFDEDFFPIRACYSVIHIILSFEISIF